MLHTMQTLTWTLTKQYYDITQDVSMCKNTESFQEMIFALIWGTHFQYSYFLFKNMQGDSNIQH